MSASLPPKYFQALLNGIGKRLFEGAAEVTNQYLVEVVFAPAGMSAPAEALIAEVERFLRDAQYHGWSVAQASEHAKASGKFSDEQIACIERYWRTNATKARHDAVEATRAAGRLETFSWRVDVAAGSKAVSELTEPVAVMELRVAEVPDSIKFELDRRDMQAVVQQVQAIDSALSSFS
mmetsp:Transcript_17439/g.55991  ORF Transcript_17439/g.55991 Transcript_17439/m.55991 type:complete len:179 (-) Transcript_17439:62-598(-)